MMWQEEINEL